ncbi:hypothetical protein FNV43_RR27295 [Rhamnella rubrinervis]|uniref:Uncharacterized protein n=1 Tax=Rhamnella rubrinervis TaxID=2594499 RepID=A0A8K0DRJ3_9ROSA|nr:hypothetical protein FNV43_RR27295 [Rhamnella rubrinervis]
MANTSCSSSVNFRISSHFTLPRISFISSSSQSHQLAEYTYVLDTTRVPAIHLLIICPYLTEKWLEEGYTHLYFGAIRVVLSSHGRHGLPSAVKMALLNSTFVHCEQAVIGTVLSNLKAGSIVPTFYPNFNVSLKDPNLYTLMKIYIHITRAKQVFSAYAASLHH